MNAPENFWIQPNVKCWHFKSSSSDDPYLPSTITQKIGEKINLRTTTGELITNVIFPSVFQRGDNPDLIDDMVDIEFLNEAELLNNLKRRFIEKNIIFTYVGPTLLIINPYKYIDELFNVNTMALYQKQINNSSFTLKDLPPHIFGISADLFKNIFLNQKNQALVISGESGAGKTENTKYAMKFLTSLGNITECKDSAALDMFKSSNNLKKRLSIKKIAIEEKILSCNPILEAFGNAKTVRNDNSSRFGKYVTLLVNKETRKIVGALIYNYLLEKSRIPNPAKSERNYHIFYHLLRGGDEQTLDSLGLKNKKVANFKYLSVSGCEEVKSLDDDSLFLEVSESFKTMHFMKEDVDGIWRIVAGVMMLGNVDFNDAKKDDTHPCSLINEEDFNKIGKLLKIDADHLKSGLTLKTILVAGQTINSPMTKDDCRFARDSLAKDLYNRLFIWLVCRLNENIIPLQDLDKTLDRQLIESSRYSIGLLDIFGFECFTFNSFEQICINFTNEKLQQLYIAYVFKSEEQEFIKEGLKDYLCELNFKDNQDIIDLLEKYPAGIFNLLDESCAIAGDDAKLLGKIRTTHKGNTCFLIPKLAKDCFIVIHTAKDVEYNINGFREKNKDDISRSISSVLEASSLPLLSSLYKLINEEPPDNHKKTSTQKFLSGKFRFQMKNLMTELESCQCHFIRCIKPNDQKKKEFWTGNLVLQQIQYLGVLQSIKVRKESYPIRRNYKMFFERFSELSDNKKSLKQLEQDPKTDYKSFIEKIMKEKFKNLNKDLVLFGKTKIFLRSSAFEIIERIYKDIIKIKEEKAVKIQRAYFRYMQMKNLRRMFKGLKLMQNLWKVRTEHKKFLKIKKSVRIIQKFWKKVLLKRNNEKVIKNCFSIQNFFRRYIDYTRFGVRKVRKSAGLIQIFWRRMLKLKQRRLFEEIKKITRTIVDNAFQVILNKKATKIEKLMRGHLCRKLHKKEIFVFKEKMRIFIQNKKVIIIQKNVRCFVRREAYKRLKHAANFIKTFFKSVWCSRKYHEMKKACIKLQRAIRPYLVQRKIIKNRLKEYFEELENDNLSFLRENEPNFFYNDNKSCRKCDYFKETTPFDNKGIEFLTLIFDFEILTDISIIYGQFWSSTFRSLYLTHSWITSINLGSTHTFITNSKENSFSWGWNDRYQQTKGGKIKIPRHVKIISCGEDYSFLISENGELLFFGENNPRWFNLNQSVGEITQVQIKDFLIEEIPIDNMGPKIRKPSPDRMLIKKQDSEYLALKKQKIIKNLKFRQVASKSHFSLVLSETGEVFYFSALSSLPKYYFFPVAIVQVCCSYNFSALLTSTGQVFTFGANNDEGELGLGDYLGRDKPTWVEGLKKEKIIEMECGFKHIITRSLTNNIWLWGSNRKLQLGLPSRFKNSCIPTLLDSKYLQNNKIIQICAGFSSSAILLQNWKAFWWGSNHSVKKQETLTEILFDQKFLEMKGKLGSEFLIIRILSCWNKHLSIFYCTVADMRNFKGNNNIFKHKILESLVKRWGEAELKSINPPFVESIANYFGSNIMKLHNSGEKKRKNVNKVNEDNEEMKEKNIQGEEEQSEPEDEISDSQSNNSSFLENKEPLIEKKEKKVDNLGEEFSFDNFKSNQISQQNLDSSSKKDGYSSLNDRASDSNKKEELQPFNLEKLKEIKQRLVKLLKIPKEKWTPTDVQFISLAFEPKMRELLSKI